MSASTVVPVLHVIAGKARVHCTARRTALGDRMGGARGRLTRKVPVRPNVLGHSGGAVMSYAPISDVLLRVSDRYQRYLQCSR
jgi:hypothetical protein